MSENHKLKVAILWHMHQPFYLDPNKNKFAMPWVRLHALKDYLDMPLTAAEHNVKVTFNLAPSLLDQIELYCNGYSDRHQDLSKIPPKELTTEEKEEILRTFFSAHYPTMIEPYVRYRQLYRKNDTCGADIKLAVEIFSTSEWRDLQVWSNLVWIDPKFHDDALIAGLIRKERNFTEDEKTALMDYQIDLMKKIIPTYKRLHDEGKIDISFTPYYHPILPLVIDTDTAREAISDIILPENRFQHPEDAHYQVEKSIEKYKSMFSKELLGMWPSEGSISDETLKLISKCGIKWVATDEEILKQSLIKSGLDGRNFSPHFLFVYEAAPETKIFFRDHGLSDKIGFVYSDWDAKKAVNDFMHHLYNLKEVLNDKIDESIVPIILDGENAWEYFPDDGTEFLNLLYRSLAEDADIEVVTFSEAAERIEPKKLPELFAGSWINHNFKIWIGHSEDNAAWDMLYKARRALVEFEKNHKGSDSDKIAKAWNQIYIAEGSDWCWWYGDDHIGPHNKDFDDLFRIHIASVYKLLGLDVPSNVLRPIHKGRQDSFISHPESLITPRIDGLVTHYYEWSGAGHFDCRKAGRAMHRVDIIARSIYFAFDYERLYIRLDFENNIDLVNNKLLQIAVDFDNGTRKEIRLLPAKEREKSDLKVAANKILEAGIPRTTIADTGCGLIKFFILIYSGDDLMEKWPLDEPIILNLPERNKEIFWQV